jgi:diguanylate cyclase (GGDEF)-like protein
VDPSNPPASWAASPLWLWLAIALAAAVVGLVLLNRRQRDAGQRLQTTVDQLHSQLQEGDHAPLPGVVSRGSLDAALDAAVQRCDQTKLPMCVMFLHMDNLSTLNDGFGQRCGDRAIARLAEALVACAAGQGTVARMGGDAFALVLPQDVKQACAAATALLTRLNRSVDGEPTLVCSIGIASYPQHGARARIVGHASTAMRTVMQAGGADFAVFDPGMVIDLREQAELLRDLRHAVERNELSLVYQPKVDAASMQITAAEALLRWHHPKRGVVSPALFIPLAERLGLIGPIGNWVIDEACRQAGVWKQAGLHMRVAINLSAYQMRQDDLVDRIQTALTRHQLSANRFTCEITESVAMEDTAVTKRSFERLRKSGLHISIDDFGVGQASLSYLRKLPAAELKIDASFVRELETSHDARAIVDAVVRLAHALHLRVVAEGVETEGQRDHLVRMGCDELQGYLFAKPMSATALSLWAMDDPDGKPGRAADQGFRSSLFNETQHAAL